MNRESEAAVLDFCARQHQTFHERDWLEQNLLEDLELATVALFLASVEWFGHRDGLLRVASRLHEGGRFSEMARKTQFDCPRFSNMLRRRLNQPSHA